jgi:hypothetical protein
MILASAVLAAAADRWLHIRVDEAGPHGERVRVNIPMEVAEKVLPAIHTEDLHNGKVKVNEAEFDGVDLRVLLEAVRTTKDNEFVTVESDHENLRVAKAGGNLLIQVRENKVEKVDISVPLQVVEALLAGGKDELDLLGAIRALSAYGDVTLVTVQDESSKVRIWVDSQNASE